MKRLKLLALGLSMLLVAPGLAADDFSRLDRAAEMVLEDVINWRHHIHQNPELSNREAETAAYVEAHLRKLGISDIRTGIAHHGIVAVIEGGKPGPTVALRADMDALPVTEQTGLPYASTKRTMYNGQEVGVMHACGHDAHVAILMGMAKMLMEMRTELPGKVMLVFQPAEEGAPEGEDGGAGMMLAEGAFEPLRPDAIFALHVADDPAGEISFRAGTMHAASMPFAITVKGKQTHGASPWGGKDPITGAARIISGLQLIPSRQLDAVKSPSLISVGSIHGGTRSNIIPDKVEMTGIIRSLHPDNAAKLEQLVPQTVRLTAEAAGVEADFSFVGITPANYNHPGLTSWADTVLSRGGVASRVYTSPQQLGAEDFSYFSAEVPGFYFYLGVNPPGVSEPEAPNNHSPHFTVYDPALLYGLKALTSLTINFLNQAPDIAMP